MPKHLFTCPTCGSHRGEVEREYFVDFVSTETIPCTCDEGKGPALQRWHKEWEKHFKTGELDEKGRVHWHDDEEIDHDKDETDSEVGCQRCLDAADPLNDVEYEEGDRHTEDYSVVWTLRCGQCGVEADFDWGQPGQLIVPKCGEA